MRKQNCFLLSVVTLTNFNKAKLKINKYGIYISNTIVFFEWNLVLVNRGIRVFPKYVPLNANIIGEMDCTFIEIYRLLS